MARYLALLLALLIFVPALAAAQDPVASIAEKGDVPPDTVGSLAVRDRSLRGIDLRKGAIQVGNLNLSTIASVLQRRLQGTCGGGEAMRAVSRDGDVTCVPLLKGTISGVAAGRGLTGGGSTGDVSLAVDPAVVQSRVAGRCQTGEALGGVTESGGVTCQPVISEVNAGSGLLFSGVPGRVNLAADTTFLQKRVTGTCAANRALTAIDVEGAATCAPVQAPVGGCNDADQALRGVTEAGGRDCLKVLTNLTGANGIAVARNSSDGGVPVLSADFGSVQRRVTGTCPTDAAVRAVAQDGTVTCTGSLTAASRVVSAYPSTRAPGSPDITLLTGAGGTELRARCATGPTRAEVYLAPATDNFVVLADRRAGPLDYIGTGPVTIASTTAYERGDFDVGGSGGNSFGNLHGQFYAFVINGNCEFNAAGIVGASQFGARPAGAAERSLAP